MQGLCKVYQNRNQSVFKAYAKRIQSIRKASKVYSRPSKNKNDTLLHFFIGLVRFQNHLDWIMTKFLLPT